MSLAYVLGPAPHVRREVRFGTGPAGALRLKPNGWRYDAEEVGLAYSYRWEVELLFREMKGIYDLGAWRVTTEEAVMVQAYGVLVDWALSRRLFCQWLALQCCLDLNQFLVGLAWPN